MDFHHWEPSNNTPGSAFQVLAISFRKPLCFGELASWLTSSFAAMLGSRINRTAFKRKRGAWVARESHSHFPWKNRATGWTKQPYETITMYLWNSCTSGCWRSSWSCRTPTRPALPGGSSSAPTWWCWKSEVNVPIAPAFPMGRCTLLAHSGSQHAHPPPQFCHSFWGYAVLWQK